MPTAEILFKLFSPTINLLLCFLETSLEMCVFRPMGYLFNSIPSHLSVFLCLVMWSIIIFKFMATTEKNIPGK